MWTPAYIALVFCFKVVCNTWTDEVGGGAGFDGGVAPGAAVSHRRPVAAGRREDPNRRTGSRRSPAIAGCAPGSHEHRSIVPARLRPISFAQARSRAREPC